MNENFVAGGVTLKDGKIYGLYVGETGNPSLGTFSVNNGLQPASLISDNLWRLDQNIKGLMPPVPSQVANLDLNLENTVYGAFRAVPPFNQVFATNIAIPTLAETEYFIPANCGTLTAFVKFGSSEEIVGVRELTATNNVGTYGQLEITADQDPYSGAESGFYRALKAKINNTTTLVPSNTSLYYFKLQYSLSESTPESAQINFYVDNILPAPYASDGEIISFSAITKHISGVPCFAEGTITVRAKFNNVIGKFYNAQYVGRATGNWCNEVLKLPNGNYRIENAIPQLSFPLIIQPGASSANAEVQFYAKQACGTESVAYAFTTFAKIDTISSETNRLTAGIGQYPSTGYGTEFNSTVLLTSNEELQLERGVYIYPSSINYSIYTPAGPDYSLIAAGSYDGLRWCCFSIDLENTFNISITFSGTVGFDNVILSGFALQIKLEGQTGWLNGNSPYSGVGTPLNDGDNTLLYSHSTSVQKTLTFGPVLRTGTLYVRIGIQEGSNKQFSSISFS